MTRVWALFFMTALSVAFLLHRPDEIKKIPFPPTMEINGKMTVVDKIPGDVFYYYIFEHIISIISAVIFISAIFRPIERRFWVAYAIYLAIAIVDFGLFRLYYRGWFSEALPWNVVKTAIMGITTEICQFREWSRK